MEKRKGFALIYTMLISALVLISIVELTMKIIPEKAVTNARTYSQRALLTAEAGASQVLFDLRNFGRDPNNRNKFDPKSNTTAHYLTEENVKTLLDASSGTVLSYQEKEFESTSGYKTTYQAKIKINSKTDVDENSKILNVDLYVLGTVKDNLDTKILARDAIKTNFEVAYSIGKDIERTPHETETKIWVPGTPAGIFNYALYSGSNIYFGGSAQTVTGNIHAAGSIDLGNAQNQVRVGGGGNAEAEGNITGKGKVTGVPIPNAHSVPFPTLNVSAYKTLADSFRSGALPYDGSKPNFPNTNDPLVLSVIQSYLGTPGTSSTLTGIQNFYNDLKEKTGGFASLSVAQWQNLKNNAKNIVYYIQDDVHINGNFSCIGTLVIDGDLIINGNSQVGDPADPGASAILVNGDVDLSNGNADLYGLFYTNGAITGHGSFYCEGSIAARGAIDLNGNYEVKYHQITNENLGVETPGQEEIIIDITYTEETYTYYSVDSAAGSGTSDTNANYTWQEIPYNPTFWGS